MVNSVQNLALSIAVFLLARACTKSGWLEVDKELDMGCQLLTRTFPGSNCRGLSCSSPLATLKHQSKLQKHVFSCNKTWAKGGEPRKVPRSTF